jgi:alpha-L-fucosidase
MTFRLFTRQFLSVLPWRLTGEEARIRFCGALGLARVSAIGILMLLVRSELASAAPSAEASARERAIRLPETDANWKRAKLYIEETPDEDYQHASAAAYEAFRDMKFGVRVHWGLYSIKGQPSESWPFLAMSNQERQDYQQLYRSWNPAHFNAEQWAKLFSDAGARCFAITTKHHEGFSMFATATRVRQRVNWMAPGGPTIEACDLAYSIMETPFRRDVIRELVDAAHRHGLKIDLYFSHPDWYDADFRPWGFHPLQRLGAPDAASVEKRQARPLEIFNEPSPDAEARMLARHRTQLRELLTHYGKIDMVCLDINLGAKVWPQLKATLKELRQLQPDVMFRARGVGNYGDYFTPEGFVPGANEVTAMPWMVIYPLGRSFSYESEAAEYKGAEWIVRTLADTVAKGGNFMVGVGPDAEGAFHPEAVTELRAVGDWLRINGEAIYSTRPRDGDLWREGDEIRLTRSKDSRVVYAIALSCPADGLVLRTVRPRPGSTIRLLGYDQGLNWHYESTAGLIITLPKEVRRTAGSFAGFAPAFRIEVDPTS